jgi:hypothetical protein
MNDIIGGGDAGANGVTAVPVVLFDVSHRPAFAPGAGYKKLIRRLKATCEVKRCDDSCSRRFGISVQLCLLFLCSNKEELLVERLQEVSCVVLPCNKDKLSQREVNKN